MKKTLEVARDAALAEYKRAVWVKYAPSDAEIAKYDQARNAAWEKYDRACKAACKAAVEEEDE